MKKASIAFLVVMPLVICLSGYLYIIINHYFSDASQMVEGNWAALPVIFICLTLSILSMIIGIITIAQ